MVSSSTLEDGSSERESSFVALLNSVSATTKFDAEAAVGKTVSEDTNT